MPIDHIVAGVTTAAQARTRLNAAFDRANEVETARGGEASLDARLDAIEADVAAIAVPAYDYASLVAYVQNRPDGPSLDLIFENNASYPAPMADQLSGTVPVIQQDPITGRWLGLRCHEARGNAAQSGGMDGAVVGVVGSGGALPTNWVSSLAAFGLDVEVLTVDGAGDRIEIEISGTPTLTGTGILQFQPSTAQTVAAAQVWTNSFWVQMVADEGVIWRNSFIEYTSGGAYVTEAHRDFVPQIDIAFPSEARRTVGTGVRLGAGIGFGVTNGVPMFARFWLSKPQLEFGAFRTDYIPTPQGATASRVLDLYTVDNVAALFAGIAQTMVIEWVAPLAKDTGILVEGDAGTVNDRWSITNIDHEYWFSIVRGGVLITTQSLGYNMPGMRGKCVISCEPGRTLVGFNGKPALAIEHSLPNGSRLQLGSGVNGALNGYIARFSIGHYSLSTAEVQAQSRSRLGIYDDFATDGPLTTAPTGHAYTQVQDTVSTSVEEATVVSSNLLTPPSGQPVTASYNGFDSGQAPFGFGASWVFGVSAVTDDGNMTLISSDTGWSINDIVASSLHIVVTDAHIGVQYFASTVLTSQDFYFSPVLAKDAATTHFFSYKQVGSAIVFTFPDGTLGRAVDVQFASRAGRYTTLEAYRGSSAGSLAAFRAVQTEH